jgi:hypothetical protein
MQQKITLGGILDTYGEQYISNNNATGQEKGLARLLASCRGQALGSHFEQCPHCAYYTKAYNSCRNRHCPLCQQKDKLAWPDKRMGELLPVGYYHLVFTIPHELNPLCSANKKLMYDILFKAASQTMLELAKGPKHLGADTGLITVLHTWGQNMMEHPHLHCIMPAGGLSFDKQYWVHTYKKDDFFIHVNVLSNMFRGKFLHLPRQAYYKGLLEFKGKLLAISGKRKFSDFTYRPKQKNWAVNIQAPFGKPGKVLEYLSRYVFRIAITDRRIKEVKNGKVLFSWKDYRTGLFKEMKLDIDEFIHRFLLHVLPKGSFKVRYYGIFTNRYRKANIELAKTLLQQEQGDLMAEDKEDGRPIPRKDHAFWDEIWPKIKEYKQPNCPACNKGRLRFAGIVPRE